MAKKDVQVVEIRPIDIKHIPIRIVGTSPLIVHAWSEKSKKMLIGTGKDPIRKKEPRNPVKDFIDSLYWLEGKPDEEEISKDAEMAFLDAVAKGARFGFKVGAIKLAANSAAYRSGWVPNQTALRGTYFLKASDGEFAEIKQIGTDGVNIPIMREDTVKIGRGTADIRYRGEFRDWYMDFVLEYNASGKYSLDDIINCINAGGYMIGIGEWRPERDGEFGTFVLEMN